MNLMFVGSGNAGSWQIRGEQIGAALGARVRTNPSEDDFAWSDVVVLVKRGGLPYASVARRHGCAVVWDALDFWAQPAENSLDESAARKLLKQWIDRVHPDLFIGATQAMADAGGGVYLPHHAWPGLMPAPAREQVSVVAYQGNPMYLGRWAGWVREACDARGWTFQINPSDLGDVDILVALRDGEWDGWMSSEWKSGVKLVNAVAAGRPVVTQASAASREMEFRGAILHVPPALQAAFECWVNYEPRAIAVDAAQRIARAYTLEAVAEQYRQALERVACPA